MTRKAVFLMGATTWVAMDVVGAATGFWSFDAKETVDTIFGAGMALWGHWMMEDAA